MQRKKQNELIQWVRKEKHKPLILRGARQVGKTWLARELAQLCGRQLIELNFERYPEYVHFFAKNDPEAVINNIQAHFELNINPENTLLFLDEIQAAPEMLAKLRWFAEDMPELPVIAAGSLLEFVLAEHEFSMPVGRIEYLHLEPMSFSEFLSALGKDKLCEFITNYKLNDDIPLPLHDQLLALVKQYTLVGGLPEAVAAWVNTGSLMEVSKAQQNLLATYRDDFNKYTGRLPKQRLEDILQSVPHQLGNKFKYSTVNKEVQAASLKRALDLLAQARLCHIVQASHGDGVPLAANLHEKAFKLILLDVGLVSASLKLLGFDKLNFDEFQFTNQGGLSEQLVGQLLRLLHPSFIEPSLYYWSRERKNASAELDYLIELNGIVVPVEVKSGSTGTLRSLHQFMYKRSLQKAIRINSDVPSITPVSVKLNTGEQVRYQLLSLPFYLIEEIPRLFVEIQY